MTKQKHLILGLLFATFSLSVFAEKDIKPEKKETVVSSEKDTVPFKFSNPASLDAPLVESFDDVNGHEWVKYPMREKADFKITETV